MPVLRTDRVVAIVLSGLTAAALLGGALFPESPRAFQVLVLLAMLAALWATGSRLASWLAPDPEPLSRAVSVFTFAVAAAVVPATWMGHFGVLRPPVFLAWTAAAFLLSRLLPEFPVTKDAEAAPEPARAARIERVLLLAAASAVALVGLREIHRLRYVPPLSFDDLSYHLSTVATWIRHGDLRMIRFAVGDPSTPFYPILGEMSSWILIAPFRDSDAAARWTQLFFAAFSVLAAAAIARRLGLSRRAGALAAICYAGIYEIFPFLAMTAGNDHSLSFFTLAALDRSLAFARRPSPGSAVAAGTACGLLLATKYIGVLYAPVVLAVLLLALIFARRPREEAAPRITARTLAGLLVLLAAAITIAGGYTYLRNWATTGNPIFPAPLRVSGIEIFPGWEGVLAKDRNGSQEARIDVWRFLTRQPEILGFYFPLTLLPAAVLAPLLALARRRWREALVFSLPALFFLQFLFLMHDHRGIRYFLPGIALAAVAFAWLLSRSDLRLLPFRAVVLLWIFGQAVWHVEGTAGRRIFAALVILASATAFEWTGRWWTRRPALPAIETWGRIAAVGLLLVAAVPLGRTVAKYQQSKLDERPGALTLERRTGAAGTRIAYAGLNAPYLFFGSRLQNQVEIVPRTRALAARTYRWGSRLAQPYAPGPYRRWRANLERLRIAYVVVHRSPWEDPERRWMARRPADFRLVFQDPETEIWQVLRRSPERGRGSLTASGRRGVDTQAF